MSNSSYINKPGSFKLYYCTLPDLLDNVAKKHPEKEAHVFRDVSDVANERKAVTFKEMRDKSLQLAAGLLKMGFEPGDRIGFIGTNCPEWLYLDYAMLRVKILMVRIPINVVYPGMLAPLLNKHKCKGLVLGGTDEMLEKIDVVLPGIVSNTTEAIREHGLASLQHLICLTPPFDSKYDVPAVSDILQIDGNTDDVIKIQKSICPDDAAIIFPTSGSTGSPKFVLHSHFAYVNGMYMILDGMLKLSRPGSVYFNDRAFSWMASCHLSSVLFSITMVHVKMSVTFGGQKTQVIYDIMDEEKVTAAFMMPYVLHDAVELKKSNISPPACLKYIATGGERIPEELLKFCQTEFTQAALMYGITECIMISYGKLQSDDQDQSTDLLFSTDLLPWIEIKVCDDDQHIIPMGEPGIIWVRSPFVTSGYLDQPELTAQVKHGSGWFFTSDVAIAKKSGSIEIIGRTRDVISKGATKIYPKTIENVLYQHPDVDKAAVVGVPDARFFNEICACVTIKEGSNSSEEELKSFCSENLLGDETSLVPKYFMIMDRFPHTPNGKIDRKSLIATATQTYNLR